MMLVLAACDVESFVSVGVKTRNRQIAFLTPTPGFRTSFTFTREREFIQLDNLHVQKVHSRFALKSAMSDSGDDYYQYNEFVPPPAHEHPPAIIKSKLSKNLIQRVTTGVLLSIAITLWMTSNRPLFALGFFIASVIGQEEYLTMVKGTGMLQDSAKIGITTALFCSYFASYYTQFHSYVLPLSASLLMFKLLLLNNTLATIHEVSTTFFGMFYLCYLPSFWILVRFLPADMLKIVATPRESFSLLSKVNSGVLITWMTWAAIAFSGSYAYMG